MWILKAAVCLAVPVLIAGQCDPDKGDTFTEQRPAPLLQEGDGDAITVWTEVTTSQFETTYVVREVYDNKTDRAFLEYYNGTAFVKILFDRKNELFYTFTDDSCSLLQTGKTANFYHQIPLLKALRLKDVPARGFLGPASFFDEFSASDLKIATTSRCEIDRHLPCVQYKTCEGSPNNYWYSQEGYPLFGQTKSRPLRYVPKSGLNIEVLSIKDFTTGQDLFVPTGLSCPNPAQNSSYEHFDTGRRSFSGEVVMKVDTREEVFVSKLDGLIIPANNKKPDGTISGIYSFTSNFLKENPDGDLVADPIKIIHDVEHNIVYTRRTREDPDEIALKEIKCTISPAGDFRPEIAFPKYGSISLTPILLETPVDASDAMVSYLGANKIGKQDTNVYEVTYVGTRTGRNYQLSRLIVSHHFALTTGHLAAVEINAFNMSNSKIFSATIYINKYETTITQLNEKLRVDDCEEYKDSSESRWLEIGFENASPEDALQISESAFQIREAFINTLQTNFGVDPMRLPQVNVDFNSQQVLVNALLLERPLLDLAFGDPLKKDFKNPTKVLGVMTMSACQITCLGMQHCTAISYCGATCSMSNANIPAAPALTDDSDECFLLERVLASDIFVSSKILRDLKNNVTTPATDSSLSLSFATAVGDGSGGGSKDVKITAITYDDTKNFDNAFHYDKDKVAIVETSFSLAKPKRRLKSSPAQLLGSFELEDCALACKNRQNCESFSFCMNSMECMISKSHDIFKEEVEEDSECGTYQKKYLDRFEKYPGLTILSEGRPFTVTNDESCAQKCVQQEDCKSFEYCDMSGDCLLLTTHIADAKDVTTNVVKPKCNHYSKKFLFDYSILNKKRGKGDRTTELASYTSISQAACAKLCSEWGDSNSTCLSFDFCAPNPDNTGTCTLRTVDGKEPADDNACNFLYLNVPPTVGIVRHGTGEAVGLSILMMLIGAGLAVGGLILFNKYR